MYKALLILLFSTLTLSGCCGTTKTFDCGLFSLEYPSIYSNNPIWESPHMVLKITSNDSYFSASYWNYDIDDIISIWDDNIYETYMERYRNMPSDKDAVLVDISKVMVETKSDKIQCLKILFNCKMDFSGQLVQCKCAHYITLFRGNLFVFGYASEGKYKKGDSTYEAEMLLRGLKFKDAPKNTRQDIVSSKERESNTNDKEHFEKKLLETTQKLNAQCPIRTDECSTLTQVLLSGNSVIYKVIVDDDCVDYIDIEEFKNIVCYNESKAVGKPFAELMVRYNCFLNYALFDTSNKLIEMVPISGYDILKYCE